MARNHKLWYTYPAPDSNEGWINHSIPMGNGHMGINLFGGIEKERIQITENSLQDSNNKIGGLNNFAEVYIDFEHYKVSDYIRELLLDEGIARVSYECDGVKYTREYIASYPNNVLAVKISASEPGRLNFVLRPTIPYLCEYRNEPGDNRAKRGTATADADTVTLSGVMEYYGLQYEGQFKVLSAGGELTAKNIDSANARIIVSKADSAVIIMSVGTNYLFDPKVINEKDRLAKLAGNPHPHEKVSANIMAAAALGWDGLLEKHQSDYKSLYGRVSFDLGADEPAVPTNELIDLYRDGKCEKYLEEIIFHFGRYMLICASRKGALPPNLQGVWNVYQDPPWRSGYWHNVNLQMNYWPAFPANLPELFESYVDYYNIYKQQAQENATTAVTNNNPEMLDASGDNGWAMGNSCWPYNISGSSNHSGYGTGAWTAELFWDYYDYVRDEKLLKDTVYPVIYGSSKFLSKMLHEYDGKLLTSPSYSPENQHDGTSYKSVGTTFDQQQIYENHLNTLKAAEILGIKDDPALEIFKEQLPKLDPFIVGESGQLKEYREENKYGDIGEWKHRHISHLLGAYPGQTINTSTPELLNAVKVSLTNRGAAATGWGEAQRVATWARVQDGEQAYFHYNFLINKHFMYNLFNNHRESYTIKLFQCDGNYGATAGVCEMLMQSNEYFIAPIPAIPAAWSSGSFSGLLARGNFEVSAKWANSKVYEMSVLSKSGGELKIKAGQLEGVKVSTDGKAVPFKVNDDGLICFPTEVGKTYAIVL